MGADSSPRTWEVAREAMWELQRQPAHDPAAAWEFVEEYSSATEAGERLEFKRTNGWDRYVNRFRVIRVDRVETITVEEW